MTIGKPHFSDFNLLAAVRASRQRFECADLQAFFCSFLVRLLWSTMLPVLQQHQRKNRSQIFLIQEIETQNLCFLGGYPKFGAYIIINKLHQPHIFAKFFFWYESPCTLFLFLGGGEREGGFAPNRPENSRLHVTVL